MGRRGGSGGRSSGGSFGGSRSSGGRSGGTFGSSRSGGRSGGPFGAHKSSGTPGSFFGGGFSPSPFSTRRYSGGGYYGGGFKGSNGSSGSGPGGNGFGGCGLSILIIFLIVIAIVAMIIIFSYSGGGDITKSTVERQPLPAGSVNETSYYTDQLGWIENETQLLPGLKHFYQKTGVQPHLYITDTINGSHSPSADELDAFARELYEQLFTDEAHLLLVFFEYNGGYMDRYVGGTQTKTVIDREAADILLDYIDSYYYESGLTDEEFFSKSFKDAAERIMTVTRSPWIIVMVIFSLVILVLLLFTWWQNVKRQKNIEAKRMEEILNTPLERFGDDKAKELAEKYDEQPLDK